MKTTSTLFRGLALAFALTLSFAARAADNTAAWKAADDARVAAMVRADEKQLKATFSDDLIYVHSNGKVDTKATFIPAIVSGKSAYHAMTYESREFREVAPGLVHMTGRAKVLLGRSEPHTELYLAFLAAYRLENGVWRFVAWQSAKLDPAPAKK
jgi:hypothetical protein